MRHPERYVACLVAQCQPGHVRGDGVRRVPVQEPEQIQEGAFAEYRQQESGRGEVRLIQEGLQRGPAAGAGGPEQTAAELGTPAEHLDVAGLVGGLRREQLHHLAKVGMQAAEYPRRDDQRGLLVLDQEGHQLDHGPLGVRGQSTAAAQSTAVAGSH